MSLLIIGSGVGRTGTHSLKLALEILGFGKCYHMEELFKHPEGIIYFKKAQRDVPVEWDKLFEDYQSAVDYPAARFYKQLIAAYPYAKIIHTVRDPEPWYKSAQETIFRVNKPSFGSILKLMIRMPFSSTVRKRMPVLKFNGKMITYLFGKDLNDKQEIIKRFNQINADVLNTIPKERSLVYDVKTGWEPLCKFLNVPVPNVPFPRSNTREEFEKHAQKIASGKPV